MSFEVKKITPATWEYYNQDIQEQFNTDEKFVDFCKYLGLTDIESQKFLSDISNNLNLQYIKELPNDYYKLYLLDMLASYQGLPPYTSFLETSDFENGKIKDEFYDFFISLIEAQQAKNAWDGTNQGIVDIIQKVFPNSTSPYDVQFIDRGTMSIIFYFEVNDEDAFNATKLAKYVQNAFFIPKPLGVSISVVIRQKNVVFGWTNEDGTWQPNQSGWLAGIWDTTQQL